jgi:hypothetical protein
MIVAAEYHSRIETQFISPSTILGSNRLSNRGTAPRMADEKTAKKAVELDTKRFGTKLDALYSSWKVS